MQQNIFCFLKSLLIDLSYFQILFLLKPHHIEKVFLFSFDFELMMLNSGTGTEAEVKANDLVVDDGLITQSKTSVGKWM